MKIAFISDIHSNFEALSAVVRDCRGKAGAFFCLGDIVGYGASPNETIELLAELDMAGSVGGNHDVAAMTGDFSRFRTEHGARAVEWTARVLTKASRAYLKDRDGACGYNAALGLAAFHGGPADPYWQYVFKTGPKEVFSGVGPEGATVFVGHSHLSFEFERSGRRVVNPGSVGQPRNGDRRAQYLIYDTNSRAVDFAAVDYDIDAAAEKIKAAGLDLFLAQRLFLGI